MKQYTTPEQTAKLIELGLPNPKSVTDISWQEYERDNPIINANTIEYTRAYSIGELIEMQPLTLGVHYDLHIEFLGTKWYVAYYWIGNDGEYYTKYEFSARELIDALYDMIIKLKEEGVI